MCGVCGYCSCVHGGGEGYQKGVYTALAILQLIEKAEAREKERIKQEERKVMNGCNFFLGQSDSF